MEVYLIRHTTPRIAKGVCYGQTDLDLEETCQEEFKAITDIIPDQFDAFYSSPLKRCKLLADHLGSNVITDPRLMEFNFGSWEMKKWDDIPRYHIDPWMNDFVNQPAPEGESMLAMSRRVKAFFSELVTKDYDRVAVITHSVVMRIVLCHMEDKPLDKAFEGKLNYGEVIKLTIDRNAFTD